MLIVAMALSQLVLKKLKHSNSFKVKPLQTSKQGGTDRRPDTGPGPLHPGSSLEKELALINISLVVKPIITLFPLIQDPTKGGWRVWDCLLDRAVKSGHLAES